ncbi:hypothetical protein P9578_02495 [Brevibacillus choshinensis]|uniref:hypothetical protein n=1 Tax=Brevibacillus choshinensis TaxID=54911 RepID=UPI002E1F2D4B|nr:hypothetical protein [Brevibacillus choshinensis]
MPTYVKAFLISFFIHLLIFSGYYAYEQYEEYSFQKELGAVAHRYPDSSIVTWDLQDPNASLFPSYFWITFPALFAGWLFLEKCSKGGTEHG